MKASGNSGFTLVELMIALAVGGIVSTAVYTTYKSQQDSYVAQEEVAVMQQNLRAAMFYVEREVRMAGCDPTEIAGAGFTEATEASLAFTMDITDDDGSGRPDGDTDDPGETIQYILSDNQLLRNGEPIAENIDAVNFVYLDRDNAPLAPPLSAIAMDRIRAVQISLLARSDRADPKILNDEVYTNPAGDILYGEDADGDGRRDQPDHFRRRMLTLTVKVRNLHIQ